MNCVIVIPTQEPQNKLFAQTTSTGRERAKSVSAADDQGESISPLISNTSQTAILSPFDSISQGIVLISPATPSSFPSLKISVRGSSRSCKPCLWPSGSLSGFKSLFLHYTSLCQIPSIYIR